MHEFVFKIATQAEWRAAEASGCYTGSADDLRDGFIHFSAPGQIAGTRDKHFAGQTDLLLVCVNTEQLGTALKWDMSRGGKAFPHLYGDLPLAAVSAVMALRDDASGAQAEDLAQAMMTGGSDAA